MRPFNLAGRSRPGQIRARHLRWLVHPTTIAARTLVAGLGVAGLAVVASLALAAPARAASGVFVTVNPSTVALGKQVGITGSCGENVNSASVSSGAFKSPVKLSPVNGVLSSMAVIPVDTVAQGYTVTLTCASGNTATTTLWVVANATPSAGPATGGGGIARQGSTLLAVGLAALLGGGLIGVAAVRRRREPVRLTGR